MLSDTIKTRAVLAGLSDNAPLIAATPRLAAAWKRRLLLASGKEVAAASGIFFWSEWITLLFNSARGLPVPLLNIQEHLLWEKVIRSDLESIAAPRHISFKGLAKRASQAYSIMQEYRIDQGDLETGGDEGEALARWIRALKSEMKTARFTGRMLAADIPQLLVPMLPKLSLPERVMVDGFEALTPAQRQLLDALRQQGCTIAAVQPDRPAANPTLTPCQDSLSELDHIALRIKSLLDRNASARIAILTCDAFSDLKPLRRRLDRVLMPDSLINPLCDQQSVSMPGEALSDWPLIQQTLQMLSLAGGRNIAFTDFSLLLFSPWLDGFDSERLERAALDAALRQQNRHHISLTQLLAGNQLDALPALKAAIAAIAAWDNSARPAGQWVKATHTLLQTLGIVQAGLDHQSLRSDAEVRQMNKFRDTLTSLTAADAVHARMSWPQFLSLLRTACSETQLAPPALFANIAVMPLAQIAGSSFDHIFVVGMDEQAFPPAARPQPLLPLSLQRRHGIPMASRSLQFKSAQWLWSQLLLAAPDIEISYAKQRDDRELQPSPFAGSLRQERPLIPDAMEKAAELEALTDGEKVALQVDETVRGGTQIIKDQSDCPFRAFVSHRLALTTLGETQPGIESTTKGSLVHAALEFIWQQLKNRAALLALDEQQRESLIREAIDHAWNSCRAMPASESRSPMEKFERKRMQRLLCRWLELEATRPAFQVEAVEKQFQLQLPEDGERSLPIRIKVDRIDRDAGSRRIVIDYKTGRKQSLAKWLGDRMEQPQLPLYAMAAQLNSDDAIAFATVRSGNEMGFEGLCGDAIDIPGIAECDGKNRRPGSWQEVLDNWREHLNALAQEFVDGRNDVAPRNSAACNYCTFAAVCRVGETGFEADNGEDE